MIIKHETCTVTTKDPVRAVILLAQLEKASKTPTAKQAQARALMGGVTRRYPKFKDGMPVAEYTEQYAMLNARMSGHGIRRGPFLTGEDVMREKSWVANFFEPLSTLPMFTPSGEVLEESI